MAKAIVVCFRNPQIEKPERLAHAIADRLAPDNVTAGPPYLYHDEKTISLIYNDVPTILKEGPNFCLGICEQVEGIFQTNAPLPDGSYALFRVAKEVVEIASDHSGSRTIWFYKDDDVFIASTSQRMVIAFLGNLELNEKACGWFLCSGTLGPALSWDKRLRMVSPRMRIQLNRKSWQLNTVQDKDFAFRPSKLNGSDEMAYKIELQNAVASTVAGLAIDPSQWTLALSGGMDSRSLLYHLQDKNMNAVTWGIQAAMKLPSSDARIAKKLAANCAMPHEYAEMDFKTGSFPTLIDRFICAGEGRIYALGGYLDALKLWGDLSSSGRGVIRGYDAFGRKPPVTNSYQVRRTCNLVMSSDYNGADIPQLLSISERDIPAYLNRKDDELLEDWRDRLWLLQRTPMTTAALEDIKLAYVEVINPLLCKQVVSCVQQLPIHLRANKMIWKLIVSEMFPGVPFAKRDAIQDVGQILSLPDIKEFVCDSLMSEKDSPLFPKKFMTLLVDNYGKDHRTHSFKRYLKRIIKSYLPTGLENIVRANLKSGPPNYQSFAMHMLMILQTKEMLTKDAQTANFLKE